MANTSTNVSTGKPNISGAVYVAAKGTTDPAGTTVADNEAFTCLGYVSEDGIENSNEMEVTEIKAWGGVIVYRSLTSMDDTFTLTLIESLNEDVLKAVYGEGNVTKDSDGKITIEVKAEDPQEKMWVFELALRGGAKRQIVIPDGAVTSREPITYNDSDVIGYGITVSAYPDAEGITHKEHTN